MNLRQASAICVISSSTRPEARVVNTGPQYLSSRGEQVINGLSVIETKLASFEPNYWLLDGSFALPVMHFSSDLNVGFISNAVSNFFREYPTPPFVDLELTANTNIDGIGLCFDIEGREGAEAVRIEFFNAQGGLISSHEVTGISGGYANWVGRVNNVRRCRVSMLRSQRSTRRARLCEVHFGNVIALDGEDIKTLNLSTMADPMGERLVMPSLRISALNNGRFDALSPQSFAGFMDRRNIVEYYQGVGHGSLTFHPMGRFPLKNWNADSDNLSLLAVGEVRGLDETFYGSDIEPLPMNDIFNLLFQNTNIRRKTPASFNNVHHFPPFFGNKSIRSILIMLARLTSTMAFVDNDGDISFIDPLLQGAAARHIGFDEMFITPEQKHVTRYDSIRMRESTFIYRPNQVAVDKSMAVSGFKDIFIIYDRPIWRNFHIHAMPGFTVSNVVNNIMFMRARVHGNGTFRLVVTGDVLQNPVYTESVHSTAWQNPAVDVKPYVIDYSLIAINRVSQPFSAFRAWFLNRKRSQLAQGSRFIAHWQQDITLQVGQRVSMQIDRAGRQVNGIVYGQEIEFDRGALRGKTHIIRN